MYVDLSRIMPRGLAFQEQLHPSMREIPSSSALSSERHAVTLPLERADRFIKQVVINPEAQKFLDPQSQFMLTEPYLRRTAKIVVPSESVDHVLTSGSWGRATPTSYG